MSVPVKHHSSEEHRRLIVEQLNRIIPVVQSVTLTTSSTTTAVTDARMGEDQTVLLIPTNSNAGSENWHISTKSNGSFVITHSSAGTTRTFDYVITG